MADTTDNQGQQGETITLYEAIGGGNDRQTRQLAMLWVLNQSDGTNSLLDIAVRAKLPFRLIRDAADLLLITDLLISTPDILP